MLEYSFGNIERAVKKKEIISKSEIHKKFISTPWQEHNIVLLASASKLWNTDQGKAIDYGNLFHEILSKIKTVKDVGSVVSRYHQQGLIDENQKNSIQRTINDIVNHKDLKEYFSENVSIYNEREIVDVDNQVIIPDRLVFDKQDKVTIIDYKTGNASKEHHQQLLKYERVLKAMNFNIDKKLLIYINEQIQVATV